jgi:hypothetical protein
MRTLLSHACCSRRHAIRNIRLTLTLRAIRKATPSLLIRTKRVIVLIR